MLQTSRCEDIHDASVSLRAALLLPTQNSEMQNNGIHEYSPEGTTSVFLCSYNWLTSTSLSFDSLYVLNSTETKGPATF